MLVIRKKITTNRTKVVSFSAAMKSLRTKVSKVGIYYKLLNNEVVFVGEYRLERKKG